MDFEKLGAFYLGRRWDPEDGVTDETLLYDASDLTTHAVCVGMTGSGKTGLCVTLLEEAAIDGVPAICVDPKGDLGNLLLTFPDLDAASFEPWVDPAEARRNGRSPGEEAEVVSKRWREGLAGWGQDGARIQRLRDAVDMAIYTPGSKSGRQLSVLASLAAPSEAVMNDAEALRERVGAAVSGLLALAGIEADPLQSPEHVFLCAIVSKAWSEGRALDLGGLVRETMDPPIQRIGVLDLDTFFPPKKRQQLGMRLNGLLASPGFSAWMEGEPLDIQRLLYTEDGKPRVVILSIAHLGEAERTFFLTVLLGELVAWMRGQAGTSSLRALLYVDEVFGFLPPVREPPTKRLFLTLLKQARAYGLGLVLATQNPADLDYKALSNCGTWWLGRLQTERDVDRVLDGLKGAADVAGQGFDAGAMRATLAGLGKRVFLMNNVHERAPVLFHTRWAMSFLRGPLTREQIGVLSPPVDAKEAMAKPARADVATRTRAATAAGAGAAVVAGAAPRAAGSSSAVAPAPTGDPRPVLPEHVDEEIFLGEPSGDFHYAPALYATVRLHYVRAKAGVDTWYEPTLLAPLVEGTPAQVWEGGMYVDPAQMKERDEPLAARGFLPIPRKALNKGSLRSLQSALKKKLHAGSPLFIGHCKSLKLYSEVGETPDAFFARVRQAAREDRDARLAKVREKYDAKARKLMEKIDKAEERVGREKDQARQKKIDTGLTVATGVIGALFGRRTVASGARSAATAARRASRAAGEAGDVRRAEEKVEKLQAELQELETELETALLEVKTESPGMPEVEEIAIAPRKQDIEITRWAIAWVPRAG